MTTYEAVLFDWSGTLVHDPLPVDRLRRAHELVARAVTDAQLASLLDCLDAAAQLPDVVDAMRLEDTSAEIHRAANMLWFERAGLDFELADALHRFDDAAAHRPLYPDAAPTLAALHAAGVKVGVVSDIHLDIRVLLQDQGASEFIDAYVLSYEHGWQKPDPRMFLTALELLDVRADQTLMVGDRCSHDGGSVAVGIAAFILPPTPTVLRARGLDVVTRMVGVT